MVLPNDNQLNQVFSAELVALVKLLIAKVTALKEENRQLNIEIEQLEGPPSVSRDSSLPLARDQQSNPSIDKIKKKHNPSFGHKKSIRELVDSPDWIIDLLVVEYQLCHHDPRLVEAAKVVPCQISELSEFRPIVIKARQDGVFYLNCQYPNRGAAPKGLEPDRFFGWRLKTAIAYHKLSQSLIHEQILEIVREMFGLELSEGNVAVIIARAGDRSSDLAAKIKNKVINGLIVKSDENSIRVKDRNALHGVLVGDSAVYHIIATHRNAQIIADVMGESRVEVWVSNCFGAKFKVPLSVFQLCLQHQLRDLQRILDSRSISSWATEMQRFFHETILLKNRFDCLGSPLTLSSFIHHVSEVENSLDRLIDQLFSSTDEQKLQIQYQLHREKLLAFLPHLGVPPINNQSEQALSPSMIYRKGASDFRSDWKPRSYADWLSVKVTLKIRGHQVFDTLINLILTLVFSSLNTLSSCVILG